MLDRIHAEHPTWTRARRAGGDNSLSLGSAFRSAGYNLVFPRGKIRSELYVDDVDPVRVDSVFAALLNHRGEIEARYGSELTWERTSGRASRVCADADGDIIQTGRHPEFIEWFLDAQRRLRDAVRAVAPAVQAEAANARGRHGDPAEQSV